MKDPSVQPHIFADGLIREYLPAECYIPPGFTDDVGIKSFFVQRRRMNPNMSITNFETACLCGVNSAFKRHFKFTGGLSLCHAPEAFIQGQIALALSKLAYVTLESHVYDTLYEAGAELRGKSPRNSSGRIDIVTWWKNGTPRILIEVKKLRHKEAIISDVKRLKQLIGRGGSTREGLVVVYASAQKPETIDDRLLFAADTSGCRLSQRTGAIPFSVLGAHSTWHYEAACFRVQA